MGTLKGQFPLLPKTPRGRICLGIANLLSEWQDACTRPGGVCVIIG